MSDYSINNLKDIIKEIGRDVVYQQLNMESPLLDFPVPGRDTKDPRKVFSVKREPNSLAKVVVKKGGFGSTGVTTGGATRSPSSQQNLAWGQFGPRLIELNVFFPEDSARVARGDGGLDLVEQAFQTAGADASRTMDRLVIDHELATTTGTANIGGTTFTIDDVSGIRPGQIVDQYASNGTSLKGQIEVTDVAINNDFSGTITCTALAQAVASGDRLYIKGSGGNVAPASRNAPVNLGDITNSAIALYSNLNAADQPAGYLDSSTSTLDNRTLRTTFTQAKVRSGEDPKVIICHPVNAQRLYELQNPVLRFATNEKMDVYGNEQMFNKARVVEDSNQRIKVFDVVTPEDRCIDMRLFWEPSPSDDGGKSGKWSRDALLLSRNRVGWEMLMTAGFNLGVSMRSAHARLNAIAA